MDTGEQYIGMCGKAKEIQAIWHSQELIGTFPSNKGFGLHYENGYEGSFYWDGEGVYCVDYEYETGYERTHTWLPRQDQLHILSGLSWQEFDKECQKYDTDTKEQAGIQVVMASWYSGGYGFQFQ